MILRDVLGFHAGEVAQILETTTESVTNALKRARATPWRRLAENDPEPPPAANSPVEREVVERPTQAFEASEVDAIVELLTEDVRFAMPPLPFEYHGRELATQFLMVVSREQQRRYRTVPTRANGQPTFGLYTRDRDHLLFHACGLIVVTLSGNRRGPHGVRAADDLSCRTSDGLLAFGRSMEAMPQSWRTTMHPTVLPLRMPAGTMAPARAS